MAGATNLVGQRAGAVDAMGTGLVFAVSCHGGRWRGHVARQGGKEQHVNIVAVKTISGRSAGLKAWPSELGLVFKVGTGVRPAD